MPTSSRARAVGRLFASGVRFPKIVAAALELERRGERLSSVRLAEAPWGAVLQVVEGALAEMDGQLLLPLEGSDLDADGAFALAEAAEQDGDLASARALVRARGPPRRDRSGHPVQPRQRPRRARPRARGGDRLPARDRPRPGHGGRMVQPGRPHGEDGPGGGGARGLRARVRDRSGLRGRPPQRGAPAHAAAAGSRRRPALWSGSSGVAGGRGRDPAPSRASLPARGAGAGTRE